MSKEFKSWLFLIILALIWGSSFILMKKGMYDASGGMIFTDSQVGALRMAIAGLVMLPFGLMNLKKITNWKTSHLFAHCRNVRKFLPRIPFHLC